MKSIIKIRKTREQNIDLAAKRLADLRAKK